MKKTAERLKQMGAGLIALLMMLLLTACEPESREGNRASGRPEVICSIYPVYDFARAVAGEHADVYRLLPAGKDSHGYEPSVGDMAAVSKADLFIYTDDELETWIGALSDHMIMLENWTFSTLNGSTVPSGGGRIPFLRSRGGSMWNSSLFGGRLNCTPRRECWHTMPEITTSRIA